MNTIRCLVVDDEPLALNVLAEYIRRTERLQLADVTTSPLHALQRVQAGEADLVFLDIEMPRMNGIEFLQAAGSASKFILTTAYAEFALEGYEYNIMDYLLKPISYERFLKAVQKMPVPVPQEGPPAPPSYFFVKSEYKLVRVDHSDILYLEAMRDYVAIHTVNGKKILTLQSLGSFEQELPAASFARVHKSFIVSLDRIWLIEKNKVSVGETVLPVGEKYRSAFNASLRTP